MKNYAEKSFAVRYLIIGLYNTAIGYLIFFLINHYLGNFAHYLIILGVSFLFSLTHAFIGQRFVVFRSNEPWIKEYLRFFLVNISGMVGNVILLTIFVEIGFELLLSQAISVLIVAIFSYFGHRYFSFKSHE